MAFPTRNDQHLGCEMGVSPCKETPICVHVKGSQLKNNLGRVDELQTFAIFFQGVFVLFV